MAMQKPSAPQTVPLDPTVVDDGNALRARLAHEKAARDALFAAAADIQDQANTALHKRFCGQGEDAAKADAADAMTALRTLYHRPWQATVATAPQLMMIPHRPVSRVLTNGESAAIFFA